MLTPLFFPRHGWRFLRLAIIAAGLSCALSLWGHGAMAITPATAGAEYWSPANWSPANWSSSLLPSALWHKEAWITYFEMQTRWSVGLFLVAHMVAAVLGLPGTFFVVIGGVVFGLVWGTIWSVVGATLGAIAAFWIARYWFRQPLERRFHHHTLLKKLNYFVQNNHWNCILTIRVMPISPFSIVNFLFGLTCIPFKTYVVGTLVGIIPGTFVYTWLGVSGQAAWQTHNPLPLMVALMGLAALSALPLVFKNRCALNTDDWAEQPPQPPVIQDATANPEEPTIHAGPRRR